MKVIVIGCGLIGLTTAYVLRRRGCQVAVIERQPSPGLETSFANGALLTPSMSDPWNVPGSWRLLLSSLVRSNAALQLRLRALPSLVGWGATFLRNSTPERFDANTLSNLRLALYSRVVMERLREQTAIDYGRAARGILRLFGDLHSLESAVEAAERLRPAGLGFRMLSSAETVVLEPALAAIAHRLSGAIHYEVDETGDAYRFCVALAEHAREVGVEFRFGTVASAFEVRSGGATAGIVPLDGALRAVGTAEFAGFDLRLTPARVQNLVRFAKGILPTVQLDTRSAKPWCGLRPTSADGVPIIGPAPVANIFVNTGHGHLGWTLAAGSAELLADLIHARQPAIDPAPFAPARFMS